MICDNCGRNVGSEDDLIQVPYDVAVLSGCGTDICGGCYQRLLAEEVYASRNA